MTHEIKEDDIIAQSVYSNACNEFMKETQCLSNALFTKMVFYLIRTLNTYPVVPEYKKSCIVFIMKKILKDYPDLTTLDRDHYYEVLESIMVHVIDESISSFKSTKSLQFKSLFSCFKK